MAAPIGIVVSCFCWGKWETAMKAETGTAPGVFLAFWYPIPAAAIINRRVAHSFTPEIVISHTRSCISL